MKEIGIGGVFNFDAGTGIPKGPVDYFSNEWLELKKHALQEAERLGLEFTMHNCPIKTLRCWHFLREGRRADAIGENFY